MEEAKPQILLWTVPECLYRVTIPAPVINEIRILAVEAFYSVPRGGVEVGGVFFGVREPDALHIRAYRPIPCQYSTGPSFSLSGKDQISLSGLLEQSQTDPDLAGMLPLGWYHSHTRSEIFLSPVDLELYRDFFPEKWQIAMVLRPANLQPTRAGFFFRDRSGAVRSDAPVQEFTLEPPFFGLAPIDTDVPNHDVPNHDRPNSDLLSHDRKKGVVPAGPPPSPPASVVAPATVSVPMAELPMPDPLPLVSAVATVADGPVISAAAPPKTGIAQPPPRIIAPPEPPAPVEIGLPSFNLAESAAKKKRSTGWIWASFALILLCGAGGAAVLTWGNFAKPVDLGLETYDINGAFLIRWDRESSVLRYATRATLEIQDGAEKTPIPLTPTELAVGGYGYMRRTGQVSVHMTVEGPTPVEEYSNFNTAQSLGSQPIRTPGTESALAQALAEKEHLKTELINESIQSSELRRQITELDRQLAEERAKNSSAPAQ